MTTALLITLIAVESSQISAIGYDSDSRTLAVQFPGRGATPGSVYHYSNVPPEVFAEFQAAESKGTFFGKNIRGKFDYEKQPGADGIVFGLQRSQEPKYTTSQKDGRITNRATGKPIPDDEPIFILRAQDVNAVHALMAYLDNIEDEAHAAEVAARMDAFEAFAASHPERMKTPDTVAA